MEVGPLTPQRHREAARVLADAFRDYPAWTSIGPRRAGPRWKMVNRFYRGALARAELAGEPMAALAADRVVGVAITYPAGSWPPSVGSFFHEAWGVAMSGPGASVRGLRASVKIDAAHPGASHAFLHTLGVDPRSQRSGAGASLLDRLVEEADAAGVPVHLTTSTEENLPYYRRWGFEIDGAATLPRGAPLWSMLRPAVR